MKVAGGGGWRWGRGCPHLQNNFKTSATLSAAPQSADNCSFTAPTTALTEEIKRLKEKLVALVAPSLNPSLREPDAGGSL